MNMKTTNSTSSLSTVSQASEVATTLLEDQPWYHGTLPRGEILALLKNEGDFLVRATQKTKGIIIVISVFSNNSPQHFMAVRGTQGWHIEDLHFPTMSSLIHYYKDTKTPLTRASGTIIRKPIHRLPWLLDNRDVTLEKELGAGQFGEVWLGQLKVPLTGETMPVAVKRCTQTGVMTEKDLTVFLKEAKLMLAFQHPHIVQIWGVAADKPPIMIVMELCPGGSLDHYLTKHAGAIASKEKIRMCLEAAKGMHYLSSQTPPCVHRDLAARNCLLGAYNEVKISDFGMSRQGSYAVLKRKGRSIPMRWAAPESLKTLNFNTMSDVYSFGVLMWEIFSDGKIPWCMIKDNKQIISKITTGHKLLPPPCTPKPIGKLMFDCWAMEFKNRPTFALVVVRLQEQYDDNKTTIEQTTSTTSTVSRTASSNTQLSTPTPTPLLKSPQRNELPRETYLCSF